MTTPDNAQTEAIQLSEFFGNLEKSSHRWWGGLPIHEKAAAVLRSQADRIASLETARNVAIAERDGANERVQIALKYKDNWMDRATKAEAQLSRAQAVPNGWKLVPVDASKKMQDAWDSAPQNEDTDNEFHGAYAAMLAASPTPPARKPLTDEQIDAALMAWFGHDLVNNNQMYRDTMRDAIEAAHGIQGEGN